MIEFSDSKIKEAESLLGGIKNALPKVQANAINRSLTTGRAEIVRSVRKDYVVAADAVRKSINVKNASMANPIGLITSKGSPIALAKFDVSKSKPVKARVKLSSSKKEIKGAFATKTSSGHNGIFIRVGKSRLPIKQLYGPSIPQMIGSKNVVEQVENKITETLDKRLEHEINRVLERGGI